MGHFGVNFGALFRKIIKEGGGKVENGAGRLQMAGVMGICGGLVGPKSGNVEKVLVFKAFLKGSRKPRGRQGKFAAKRAGPKKLNF